MIPILINELFLTTQKLSNTVTNSVKQKSQHQVLDASSCQGGHRGYQNNTGSYHSHWLPTSDIQ